MFIPIYFNILHILFILITWKELWTGLSGGSSARLCTNTYASHKYEFGIYRTLM